MITTIRRKAGAYILNRNLKQNKRGVRPISLKEVQSVLIISDMDRADHFKACLDYEKFLRREEGVRQVDILAYTDKKQIPDDLIANQNHFFLCRKDLNWFYSPISKDIVKLLKSKHQLLIDASFEEKFPLNFALAVSNASFKVGKKEEYHEKYLDFMVDLKNDSDIHALFSQLNHFLNMFSR